jgi:hypothetical protein
MAITGWLAALVLHVAGITIDADLPKHNRDAITHWIDTSARAVAAYYGAFPVPRVHLVVVETEGRGVSRGTAFPMDGGTLRVAVGRSATADELARDWVMTHEMIHLGFPSLAERHHWLEEGLATYVEPLARIRIGNVTALEMWRDLVRDMPKGLPQEGDRGLDHTPTWGRTYWGGALFCLLADVTIHERTSNRKGLVDALRAIAKAGGTIAAEWSIDRVIATGDAATGVPVLRELYDRMKDAPAPVDLDDLWRRLGVRRQGESVVLDDAAPLAAVRRAIAGS